MAQASACEALVNELLDLPRDQRTLAELQHVLDVCASPARPGERTVPSELAERILQSNIAFCPLVAWAFAHLDATPEHERLRATYEQNCPALPAAPEHEGRDPAALLEQARASHELFARLADGRARIVGAQTFGSMAARIAPPHDAETNAAAKHEEPPRVDVDTLCLDADAQADGALCTPVRIAALDEFLAWIVAQLGVLAGVKLEGATALGDRVEIDWRVQPGSAGQGHGQPAPGKAQQRWAKTFVAVVRRVSPGGHVLLGTEHLRLGADALSPTVTLPAELRFTAATAKEALSPWLAHIEHGAPKASAAANGPAADAGSCKVDSVACE